ncbi:hypothetical protein ACJX0J_010116, partial [Zea mays]
MIHISTIIEMIYMIYHVSILDEYYEFLKNTFSLLRFLLPNDFIMIWDVDFDQGLIFYPLRINFLFRSKYILLSLFSFLYLFCFPHILYQNLMSTMFLTIGLNSTLCSHYEGGTRRSKCFPEKMLTHTHNTHNEMTSL